jgi:IclR family KDG regulon transcriptional repressor
VTFDAEEPLLKSLDLALRVLGSFESTGESRRVTDVAREFNCSKPTAYRVLATLERHGYVVQDQATEEYRLGPRLRRLSRMVATSFDLTIEAEPYLRSLRDSTGDTVHLATLEGGEAVYIAKQEALHPVQVVSKVGARCPAHAVATGKILLAHCSRQQRTRHVGHGLLRFTELTRVTPEAIEEEARSVQDQGYAVNRGEWRREVRGVAAPVRDDTSRVIAALGVCAPAVRMTEERLAEVIPLVVDSAIRLSNHLGAPCQPAERSDVTIALGLRPATDADDVLEHPAIVRGPG